MATARSPLSAFKRFSNKINCSRQSGETRWLNSDRQKPLQSPEEQPRTELEELRARFEAVCRELRYVEADISAMKIIIQNDHWGFTALGCFVTAVLVSYAVAKIGTTWPYWIVATIMAMAGISAIRSACVRLAAEEALVKLEPRQMELRAQRGELLATSLEKTLRN